MNIVDALNALCCSPRVVLLGMQVEDIWDKAVEMAAIGCASVHRHSSEVVLIALRDLGLPLLPQSCKYTKSAK